MKPTAPQEYEEFWKHANQCGKLPRWNELPKLELYMDQVITLIESVHGAVCSFVRTRPHPFDDQQLRQTRFAAAPEQEQVFPGSICPACWSSV